MCSEFAIQIWPIAPQNPIRLWKTSYHIWDLWPVSKIVTLGQLSLLRFEHLYDNAFWEIVIFFWKFPFSQPRTLVEAPAQFEANWQRKLQAKAMSSKKTTQQRGGEKPHGCKMCTYTCTSATDLKKHMPVHTGEKLFSCKQCEYTCTRAGNLKRHMLTHSGDKIFRGSKNGCNTLVPVQCR